MQARRHGAKTLKQGQGLRRLLEAFRSPFLLALLHFLVSASAVAAPPPPRPTPARDPRAPRVPPWAAPRSCSAGAHRAGPPLTSSECETWPRTSWSSTPRLPAPPTRRASPPASRTAGTSLRATRRDARASRRSSTSRRQEPHERRHARSSRSESTVLNCLSRRGLI